MLLFSLIAEKTVEVVPTGSATAYVVAILSTVLILATILKPSRRLD